MFPERHSGERLHRGVAVTCELRGCSLSLAFYEWYPGGRDTGWGREVAEEKDFRLHWWLPLLLLELANGGECRYVVFTFLGMGILEASWRGGR